MKWYRQQGVTLIELIIFIVVLGILGSGILMAFVVALAKSPDIAKMSRASELAQERLELILGQYEEHGFSTFTDLCDGTPSEPAVCTLSLNYQIADPTIVNNWNGDPDYQLIQVVVSGDGESSLNMVVTQY